ncbi:phage tail assembly protein [Agrobacterium rosae]|uniref:phage tail assembly protein n=1 Tax=Agrobacterium rosae TaxID=1972867 RepID=UPI003A7FE074
MTEAVTVELATPVTHNDTTYSKITFQEPTVGDLIVGDQMTGGLAKMTAILASVSGVPLPAFKKIGAKDFQKIVTATGDLLGNGAKTTGE